MFAQFFFFERKGRNTFSDDSFFFFFVGAPGLLFSLPFAPPPLLPEGNFHFCVFKKDKMAFTTNKFFQSR